MKIGELKNVDRELYYIIMLSRIWECKEGFDIQGSYFTCTDHITDDEKRELTIKDLFDLFTEDQIMRNTRRMGKIRIERLKELA